MLEVTAWMEFRGKVQQLAHVALEEEMALEGLIIHHKYSTVFVVAVVVVAVALAVAAAAVAAALVVAVAVAAVAVATIQMSYLVDRAELAVRAVLVVKAVLVATVDLGDEVVMVAAS